MSCGIIFSEKVGRKRGELRGVPSQAMLQDLISGCDASMFSVDASRSSQAVRCELLRTIATSGKLPVSFACSRFRNASLDGEC